jgi:hypothetical protein
MNLQLLDCNKSSLSIFPEKSNLNRSIDIAICLRSHSENKIKILSLLSVATIHLNARVTTYSEIS